MKMPVVPKRLGRRELLSVSGSNKVFAELFHIRKDQIQYGISYNLEGYINSSFCLNRDDAPCQYEIFLSDYEGSKNFSFDFQDDEIAKFNQYLCVSLVSNRCFYDVGQQLTAMESNHPSWGKFLLDRIGNNGVLDILTPGRLWEEADRYFAWIGEDDSWDCEYECTPHGDTLTPETFKEYYPVWVLEKAPKSCPEDLAEIPVVAEFLQSVKFYLNRPSAKGAWANLHFMELPGCYASAGGVCFTGGRNELERDPVVIASDEECNCYNETDGCHPGGECFEFLLTPEHHERNLYVKERLDCFMKVLTKFENLMDWIRGGHCESV